MSERDLKSESQKYLDEMMRFYSMNKNASVNTQKMTENKNGEFDSNNDNIQEDIADEKLNEPENKSSEPGGIINTVQEDIADQRRNEPENSISRSDSGRGAAEEDIADELRNEPENNSMYSDNTDAPVPYDIRDEMINGAVPEEEDLEDTVSLPVIPEAVITDEAVSQQDRTYNRPGGEDIIDTEPSDEETDPYIESGYIKVEVRTGGNALPVPGASVTIENKSGNGSEIILASVTDNSGSIGKIQLPAPANSKGDTPGSYDNYSVYTVSVYSKGFYREVSEEVPVFSGITSIQRFNLIPLPFNYDDRGQAIVNNNTEPEI